MSSYPVQLEVTPPPRFQRIHLLIRFAIGIVLGWLGITMGWLASLLFFTLPIIAAIVISARGPAGYLDNTGPRLWSGLTWLLSFTAYMLLLTDEPIDFTRVRTELHATGRPTTGSALLRLIMTIPSAIVLCFLGVVSCVLWFVAALAILFTRTVPHSILSFQTGYLRWEGRLFAYHASLVEEYPPFSFESGSSQLPTAAVQP